MYQPRYIPKSDCPTSNFAVFPEIRMILSIASCWEDGVTINILDDVIKEGSYTRLFIKPGYRLSEDDEKYFFQCCHSEDLAVDFYVKEEFYKLLWDMYGIEYRDKGLFGQALEHFYVVTHPCNGSKVVLYEEGYPFLAYNLDYMDFINENGTTPEEIMGLPESLLEIFNTHDNQVFLRTKEDCELIKKIYDEYYDFIEYPPSKAQWLYLTQLYCSEGKYEFINEIYGSLDHSSYKVDVSKYETYYNYRKVLEGYFTHPGLPKAEVLEDFIQTQKIMLEEICMEKYHDRFFQRCFEESVLGFEYGKFFVREVKSFREFCNECSMYDSGVFRYLQDFKRNENEKFLIMRSKKKPEISLAYIHILDGRVKDIEKNTRVPWAIDEIKFLEQFFNDKELDTKSLINYFKDCVNRYNWRLQRVSPEGIEYLKTFGKSEE